MTSDAQEAANLRNAKLSTGPRTVEGKARSSQNAVRHGLLSVRTALVSGEDPAEYDRLEQSLREALTPAEGLESVVFHELVDRTWRLRRAARIEAGLFNLLFAEEQESWAQQETAKHVRVTSPLDDHFEDLSGTREIVDEASHAAALERKAQASAAIKGDDAAYGRAFHRDASTADAFTKLGRYERHLYTTWRRCFEEFKVLQRQRLELDASRDPMG